MKTYIFLTILAIGLWTSDVKAQTSLSQANRQYEMMAYTKAIELYEQALKENLKDSTKVNTLIKLGHSYHQIRDTPNAERVFRSLLSEGKAIPRSQANSYLYYAQALASNGKYDEAKEVYERYNRKIHPATRLNLWIILILIAPNLALPTTRKVWCLYRLATKV
jgi:tetratricopeptide (TPR) repeat protein